MFHDSTNQILADHLTTHPELVRSTVLKRFTEAKAGNLTFLLRILAIHKALGIQAHPDKRLAERLYTEQPDLYKGMPVPATTGHVLLLPFMFQT